MEEEFGGYDQEDILGSEINLMKPEEKEMVYQQILSFFLPGKSSDKVKKASKK